jgi:hypothetical protein
VRVTTLPDCRREVAHYSPGTSRGPPLVPLRGTPAEPGRPSARRSRRGRRRRHQRPNQSVAQIARSAGEALSARRLPPNPTKSAQRARSSRSRRVRRHRRAAQKGAAPAPSAVRRLLGSPRTSTPTPIAIQHNVPKAVTDVAAVAVEGARPPRVIRLPALTARGALASLTSGRRCDGDSRRSGGGKQIRGVPRQRTLSKLVSLAVHVGLDGSTRCQRSGSAPLAWSTLPFALQPIGGGGSYAPPSSWRCS